ncbi:glycerophosphoryl diester phosphodiesterase membrane domain-containing protein [Microbispora sp. H11081]|uniref:glycerophosphoryl diester phosphodiesterase membrane domain-containing protein n=1 Tax=Microbispora sp. H11081 TaxID=2729107 RepID=UPI001473C537|nr:glycerophosphoryl diester phosphodiesterase membrane domain-containing protein [Microbispora sp. H11081]
MTDGPGSTPDVPSGWAAEQPPAYGGSTGSWASPGSPGGFAAPPPPAPGQPPQGGYPPAPHAPVPGGPYAYRPPDAPRPGIIPLRPLALGDILDGTIKMIRSNPKATLVLSAIVAAITTIPAAIGQAISLDSLSEIANDPYAADAAAPLAGSAAQLIGAILGYVMTFVGTTILTGVLTRVLGRAVFGGRITVGEAWRLARSRVPALFGLVLLQALILLLPLLALVAVFVILAAAGAFDGTFSSAAGVGVFVGLLFFLAYIPYLLFFYTRLSLAAPAVVLEGRGAVDAISRSWRLVKGDSWRVLGILLLTSLLAAVVSGVLSVPFTFGGTLIGMLSGGTAVSTVLAALLLAAGQVIAAMIVYPFQAGVFGLLYADRRMRAEAFDLVLQTAAARNQSQGWVHAGIDDLWHPGYGAGPGSAPYHGAPPHGPYGPYGPQG